MNFFSGFYLLFSWTAFFSFSRNADLTDWRFRFKHKFIIQYSYRLEKKKFTALSRVWKFWGCQNSAIIMTNGIRKVRKGVDTFIKRILILVSSSRTQCFRIRPLLHQSFPCKKQSSTLLWQEGGRRKPQRTPSLSALLFSCKVQNAKFFYNIWRSMLETLSIYITVP